MIITEKLRQRFVKDAGIPIKIFIEPYFSNLLDLYEENYYARTKWNEFLALLENFDSDQSYFAYYNKVKDNAITFLANNPAMQYFCQKEDMKRYAPQFEYPSHSVFKCTNVGRHFVSIDMIKGNFTALRHYNPAIVDNKETYEDFIGMFTDGYDYLQKSKYTRQVCFGNANPRRQTTYERYLMEQVLSEIFARTKILGKNVACLGTDEIVLDVTDYVSPEGGLNAKFAEMLNRAIDVVKADGINVRREYFKLYRIKGTSGYMRKYEFETAHKGVDFKCVEADEMPFVIRSYKQEPIREEDLVFVYNGRLAKLLEPIQVEFTDVWTPEDERKNKGEADG